MRQRLMAALWLGLALAVSAALSRQPLATAPTPQEAKP